jgi:hypothetical protein
MAEKRETVSARVARIEENMANITKKHAELEDMVKILFDSQIKTDERFRQTDERIEKLVIAIGELIRRMPLPEPATRP